MSCIVNELTGEVEVTLEKGTFTLHATLPNVAALMAALQITGLRQLNLMLSASDPRVIYQGMRLLCTSDNKSAIEGLLFGRDALDACEAVQAAMTAGMPEAEDKPGKHEGETMKSPGSA